MTLASTVFRKSTFQMFQFLNALESKFDLDVKWVKGNPGSSFEKNLVGPTSQMLHTKSQGHQSFVLEKKIFKKVFTI